jgi:hypothetical protein
LIFFAGLVLNVIQQAQRQSTQMKLTKMTLTTIWIRRWNLDPDVAGRQTMVGVGVDVDVGVGAGAGVALRTKPGHGCCGAC